MAAHQHWTLVGLSFLLLAMTEFTAPASSFHLRGEESYPGPASPYSEAVEEGIGTTLRLLSYLLAESKGAFQSEEKLLSLPDGEGKDLSKPGLGSNLPELLSVLERQPRRQSIMAALLQRLKVKTLLTSVGDGGETADENSGGSDPTSMVGFESLLNRAPTDSSAASGAEIDDVIPTSTKSKRGRHGHYGAMPPTMELCRMMNVRCY